MDIDKEIEKCFWSKVDIRKDFKQCWNWTGAKKKQDGYGNVRINSKWYLPHRVAWTLSNFDIPDGYVVTHVCDNPMCCNPNHLLLGTNKSNFCDMIFKNRQDFKRNKAIGTRNVNAKLDDNKVLEIKRLYNDGKYNQYELADIYNVSQHAICNVVNNKTWNHVKD